MIHPTADGRFHLRLSGSPVGITDSVTEAKRLARDNFRAMTDAREGGSHLGARQRGCSSLAHGSGRPKEAVSPGVPPSIEVFSTLVRREDMPDDTSQDHIRIRIDQIRDVRYWAGRFGVTEQELRDAVVKVGTLVRDVKSELGGRG
jgi:hypothetical protein